MYKYKSVSSEQLREWLEFDTNDEVIKITSPDGQVLYELWETWNEEEKGVRTRIITVKEVHNAD